ncbi:MAG: hypothetical protein U9O53_05355 [archaeon]|nr:hypothetical protein [archaeon]
MENRHKVYEIDIRKETADTHRYKTTNDTVKTIYSMLGVTHADVFADVPKDEWLQSDYEIFLKGLETPQAKSGVIVSPEGTCIIQNRTQETKEWFNIAQKYGIDACYLEDILDSRTV